MLISTPTEPQFSSNLSAKLQTLPALIDIYVLIVDRVMRKHGFDHEKCEFIREQNLLDNEHPLESSAHALRDCLELRIDPIHSRPKAEPFPRYKPAMVACESDLLVAV